MRKIVVARIWDKVSNMCSFTSSPPMQLASAVPPGASRTVPLPPAPLIQMNHRGRYRFVKSAVPTLMVVGDPRRGRADVESSGRGSASAHMPYTRPLYAVIHM